MEYHRSGRRLARRDQEPGPGRQPLLDRHHHRAFPGRGGQARSILRDLQRHQQVQGGRVGTTEERGELQHTRGAHTEAVNGRHALELCRQLHPDLVLMDVRMPEIDGLSATRAIKEELPNISVLIVTTYDDPDYLFEAVGAGAAGYVLKNTRKHKLIEVIRKVLSGEATLDSEVAMQLIKRFANKR